MNVCYAVCTRDSNCKNGGLCVGSTCKCRKYYIGANCQTKRGELYAETTLTISEIPNPDAGIFDNLIITVHCMCACVCMRSCVRVWGVRACVRACVRSCVRACVRACVLACVPVLIYDNDR